MILLTLKASGVDFPGRSGKVPARLSGLEVLFRSVMAGLDRSD